MLNLTQAMNYTQVEDFNVVTLMSEFVEREIAGLILPADVYRHAVNETGHRQRVTGWRAARKCCRLPGGLCSEFTSGCRLRNSYYYNYSSAAGLSNASGRSAGTEQCTVRWPEPECSHIQPHGNPKQGTFGPSEHKKSELMLDQRNRTFTKRYNRLIQCSCGTRKFRSSEVVWRAAQLAYDFEEQIHSWPVPAFIRLIRFGYVWQPPVPKRLRQNTTFCFVPGYLPLQWESLLNDPR